MRVATVAAGLALIAVTAQAEITRETFDAETVASLHELCSADETTSAGKYAVGFCYGWIEGVGQFYEQLVSDSRFEFKSVVCTAGELTREEVRASFVNWAKANPQSAGRPALDGIFSALKETYPCK